MGQIFLVVPDAPIETVTQLDANRQLGESGIRLGILDNSKGNADHLLRYIVDGIKALLPVASVIALRKDSVSLPAPADILDRLAAESDYVLSAMGD